MNFPTSFLLPLLLSSFPIGDGAFPNRVLGSNQAQLKAIFDTIDPEGPSSASIPTRYSAKFRPPSTSPTLVYLSLNHVQLRTRGGFVGIVGQIEIFHNDSRLAYETPKGFTRNYIDPKRDLDVQLPVWYPELSTIFYPRILFNGDGLVYCSSPFGKVFPILTPNPTNSAELTTSIQFYDQKYSKEELILEWKPDDAYVRLNNTKEFDVIQVRNASHRVTPNLKKCQEAPVSINRLGKEEHSCLQLSLTLTKV